MEKGSSYYHNYLSGDDDSITDLIREYKDGLILYINGFTHNICVAEDLMEDTFVKIVTKKPPFHGNSSFKTWLYAIARNVTIDWIRKNRKIQSIPEDELKCMSENSVEQSYIKEEGRIQIHKALWKLKEDYRQVLYLVYFENFSNAQVAIVMKKSKRQIENLLYRAKQLLKLELEREGVSFEEL